MKNGNYPINPIVSDEGFVTSECHYNETALNGLTKREYFAGLAMQGLLSANAMYKGRTDEIALLCQDAIAHADELLKQLEK